MIIRLVLLSIRPAMERARAVRLIGLFAFLLASSLAWGQIANPVLSNGKKVRVPLPHLYWHFLMYQNHLDQVAAQRMASGKDGSWLSNHFEQKLGFTDAQFAVVRSTAQRLQVNLRAVDAQAKAIIAAGHQGAPPYPGTSHPWGPFPPELKALAEQHEGVIQTEVANLKAALGPGAAAQLETFLQNDFARNVTVQNVPPGPTLDQARQHLMQAVQDSKEGHQ
jgi:hypothetical protein